MLLLLGSALAFAAAPPNKDQPDDIGKGFEGRSGGIKDKAKDSITPEAEAAIALGLKFLAMHQAPDGHWSLDRYSLDAKDEKGKRFDSKCTGAGMKNDIAGTAFGVWPFLGAGITHKTKGDKTQAAYAKVVERGLKYLLAKQGRDGGINIQGAMYEHGLATLVLCQAYGMTSDPALKAPAQKAIDYIVKAQHKDGGWRYAPKQAGDTSSTGWQVTALKSGQLAGLKVPKATLDGANKFLDSVMDKNNFGYGYTSPGSTPTLTAVGLLCRQHLGWNPRKKEFGSGIEFMKKTPAKPDHMYYVYYSAQVMHHLGGDDGKKWNENLRDALVKSQDQGKDTKHPYQRGSWDPKKDEHGGAWGRIGQTSLSLVTLEIDYRHLPLYRRDVGDKGK
jgi:hypothetical protein